MRAFREHETDVLVATTVIEVGVDVPNATVMVIEDADRFGLLQLHQLRGRIGRGKHRSYCYLLAEPTTPQGEARMEAMTQSGDGFDLAERDLAIRGAGEVFGERQAGWTDLKLGRLPQDEAIVFEARAGGRGDPRRRPRPRAPLAAPGRGAGPPRRRGRVSVQELTARVGGAPQALPATSRTSSESMVTRVVSGGPWLSNCCTKLRAASSLSKTSIGDTRSRLAVDGSEPPSGDEARRGLHCRDQVRVQHLPSSLVIADRHLRQHCVHRPTSELGPARTPTVRRPIRLCTWLRSAAMSQVRASTS